MYNFYLKIKIKNNKIKKIGFFKIWFQKYWNFWNQHWNLVPIFMELELGTGAWFQFQFQVPAFLEPNV